MTTHSPTTLIARWNTPNPQGTVPVLARSLSTNLGANSSGRWIVNIRTLRLPAPAHGANTKPKQPVVEGRNLYMVRKFELERESTALVVQDPNQPLRSDSESRSHSHWTYAEVAPPSPSSSSAAIDSFIGRVLVAPAASTASASASSPSSSSATPAWQARPTALSIEGATFSISSNPISHPTNTDWIVKLAVVNLKGGTAGGTTRGCLIQGRKATYLPIPYLPAHSTLVRDFLYSLFPAQAVQNGEVSLVEPNEQDLVEAGILDPSQPGDEEWEWQDKHSLFTYIKQFKKEGLL
ncbi:uncharacterized protein JCM15063_003268 [Sporobolomyces koalae]|uniref:uncharacterized protein n=1 Tax=Sporobolomyces koalae TaxID=500713 RepID=UPI00317B0B0A